MYVCVCAKDGGRKKEVEVSVGEGERGGEDGGMWTGKKSALKYAQGSQYGSNSCSISAANRWFARRGET